MNFNNFNSILKKLFKSSKKSNKVTTILKQMIKKKEINENISLFLLKVTIIILSYYPEKIDLIFNFFITVYNSKLESKYTLLSNLKSIYDFNDSSIDDFLMDKMIFSTLDLLENCYIFGCNGINLFITIINEILINLIKIKLDNNELKYKIYLMFIRKSNKFIIESNKDCVKGQVYFKVMEICGVTAKIINNYIK